jgi:3-deoxy-alpha-D-manno-octulosonate 8-oxidase
MHKNFKNIDHVVFGRGSFNQLGEIIRPHRNKNDQYMTFIVDAFFKGNNDFVKRIPAHEEDEVIFIDVDPAEPTTEQIDELRDRLLAQKGLPAGIIGVGGGSIMDIAKALSVMVTNIGPSQKYQGLNLAQNPGIYHVGVPTISGTGAECSMTAVLTGPEKKLGIKCDWTTFNQVVLDSELTETVPVDKWFYTGMDTFIHCHESASGIYNNAFSRAYGEAALQLCREVYLGQNAGQNAENDDKLMIASLMGGLSLTYSEVGVCHALSYGLGFVLKMKHCYANCIAFQHLEDIYGEGVGEFKEMLKMNQIELPQNLSAAWDEATITAMAKIAYALPHMWRHAFGLDWEQKVTLDYIKDLFRRL